MREAVPKSRIDVKPWTTRIHVGQGVISASLAVVFNLAYQLLHVDIHRWEKSTQYQLGLSFHPSSINKTRVVFMLLTCSQHDQDVDHLDRMPEDMIYKIIEIVGAQPGWHPKIPNRTLLALRCCNRRLTTASNTIRVIIRLETNKIPLHQILVRFGHKLEQLDKPSFHKPVCFNLLDFKLKILS